MIALKVAFVVFFASAFKMAVGAPSTKDQPVVVHADHPLVYFHGRWDDTPGTWWAGSGFKLHVENLSSLKLNLGPHTTGPQAAVGLSVNYEPFQTVNLTAGANILPLGDQFSQNKNKRSVVRLNVEGWQNNRIQFESLELNHGARLLPYKPSDIKFQFIGDSLTAGQYNIQGVDSSWGFLTGENFKAEHNINAQPGACLTDQLCWGNYHGVSYQYFKTEDTGYYYTTDHNYTTDWNFKNDHPTHVVIHIGANDNAYNITHESFVATYLSFVERLRDLYPHQPFFIFTPWGWPQADGTVGYYYDGAYAEVVKARKSLGDRNVYLVDTTGWVGWDDVYHDNVHPNEQGHKKVAELFTEWLERWGLQPKKHWATIPE